MVRSSFHCPDTHHHQHHHHHRRKHHSHHDLTLSKSSINIQEDWRPPTHSTEEKDLTTSQSEIETTENDITDTTTEQSCLCQMTNSRNVTPRHEVYPLHVSVNLRIGGTSTVLLPEDVFIPLAGSETLESIFAAALVRYPQQVGRYISRTEKDVVILCLDEAKNTYLKTSVVFASLSKLQPIRLIFCVIPNVVVIRELDSQIIYKIKVNARSQSDPECILDKDMIVEARGSISAKQLWANLSKALPQIRGLCPTGLLARRPDDNVVVRFVNLSRLPRALPGHRKKWAMVWFPPQRLIADLVKSQGRFVFILGGHLFYQKPRRHTQYECLRRCGHQNTSLPDNKMRHKLWFRFQPYRYGQGKRMFQWGLLPKKRSCQYHDHHNSKG